MQKPYAIFVYNSSGEQCTIAATTTNMKCSHCGSAQISKNGHRRGKQNYRCKACDRQFLESYTPRGYAEEIKCLCLKMYQRGLNLRQIEQFTGIPRSTLSH